MFFQILESIAEFEHALMSERTMDGLAAARARIWAEAFESELSGQEHNITEPREAVETRKLREAWSAFRRGELDASHFGVYGTENWGVGEIRGNAVKDLAALNKVEMLPWDVWGVMPAPGEPIEPVLDRLAALKRDWLRANKLSSPLLDNNVDVLPRLVRALSQIGNLRIFTIECSGEIVAGSVNVVQKAKMMASFSAYDPKYVRASPGISLMTEYTRWAFDHGITVVDYLRGGEPYKFEFANAAIELTAVVQGWSLAGKAFTAGLGALAAAKRLRARLRSGAEAPSAMPAYGGAYLTQSGMSRIR